MNFAEILNIFPPFSSADHCTDSEEQDIIEGRRNFARMSRVGDIIEKPSENSINRHEDTPEKGV
jgi:hypothetical protein